MSRKKEKEKVHFGGWKKKDAFLNHTLNSLCYYTICIRCSVDVQ